MTAGITKDDFSRMIGGAAAQIRAHGAMLSELDCAVGDGDHGSTMLRAVERLEKVFAPDSTQGLRASLKQAGWSVLGADGGASSSLLGVFFGGMADAPACDEVGGARDLAAIFEDGLNAVRKRTKAQPGDKTMMDALVPAIAAMRAAAESGRSPIDALHDAAGAARAGAEATRDLTARHGRAKFLGEKTRGHVDPGAASISLLFEGFYRGLAEGKGELKDAGS